MDDMVMTSVLKQIAQVNVKKKKLYYYYAFDRLWTTMTNDSICSI